MPQITIRDLRLLMRQCGESLSVEIRPNGAVWVYAAVSTTVSGLAGTKPQPCRTMPVSTTSAALSKLVNRIGQSHGFYPSVAVESRVDGELVDELRHPRMEIHPQMVAGLL